MIFTRYWVLLAFVFALPLSASTIYKSVDERGRITYSDQPPPVSELVDILEYREPVPVPEGETLARLQAMREVTDRMAADRREREAARAEQRKQQAQESQTVVYQNPGNYYPLYGRRYYQRPPLLRPPHVRPPITGPAIRSDYPAKLVRRHYAGAAARVFNPGTPQYAVPRSQ